MLGVHGSLITILKAGFANATLRGDATAPVDVAFDERPAQQSQYPWVNIRSGGTRIEYAWGGDDLTQATNKTKDYNVGIEVYGRTLAEAELLGEAVERILEQPDVFQSIISKTEGEADGWEVSDNGDERYAREPEWTPLAGRSYSGTMSYTVRIYRSF